MQQCDKDKQEDRLFGHQRVEEDERNMKGKGDAENKEME